MNAALVIANNHYNALGVVRSLGEQKIPVRLLLTTDEKTFVEKSRYVTAVTRVAADAEALIQAVCASAAPEGNTFVFPTSDFSAEVLDEYRGRFPANIVVPHMNGRMTLLQDKEYSKALARECGLDVPAGTVCQLTETEIPQDIQAYPVILKPVKSIEGKKSDIVCVRDAQELSGQLSKLKEKGYSRVIMEQFVAGKDERMLEIMGYCTPDGKVHLCGIICKEREFPLRNGSTSYAYVASQYPGVNLDAVTSYLGKTEYTGLFDMELKYADGKAYFIECNFRNGAPGYAFTQRGKNIPYLWMSSYPQATLPPVCPVGQTRKKHFMCEHIDVIHLFKRNVGFFRWVGQYLGASKIFGKWRDPKPLFFYAGEMFGLVKEKAHSHTK